MDSRSQTASRQRRPFLRAVERLGPGGTFRSGPRLHSEQRGPESRSGRKGSATWPFPLPGGWCWYGGQRPGRGGRARVRGRRRPEGHPWLATRPVWGPGHPLHQPRGPAYTAMRPPLRAEVRLRLPPPPVPARGRAGPGLLPWAPRGLRPGLGEGPAGLVTGPRRRPPARRAGSGLRGGRAPDPHADRAGLTSRRCPPSPPPPPPRP